MCPFAFDGSLKTRIAAHHLDLRRRAGQIFRVGFELRVRVGEVQKRRTLPSAIRSGRAGVATRAPAGMLELIADKLADAMSCLRVQFLPMGFPFFV